MTASQFTHPHTHHHVFSPPNQQERAKAEGGGDPDDAGDEGAGGDGSGADEGLEAAAEQDGLQGEVLRGKNMDVASMDALKKRIEVRRTGLSVL